MKIDRQIGILTLLLQREKVTAPYLAQRFEVSKRTIGRDIEDLCKAGIPVVTLQGSRGGITLAEGYKIDKTLLTRRELQAVFAGLSGLDSVTWDKRYRGLMEKFSSGDGGDVPGHTRIDLSSHYKETLAPKIACLQQAAEESGRVAFRYFSARGERRVTLEPCLVAFQWSSWYVFGFDVERGAFRTFKLNRLWELERTGESFEPRELPQGQPDFEGFFTPEIQAVVRFDRRARHRLAEEYGPDCWEEREDGSLGFSHGFTSREYLLEWLMGFGDMAELLEPRELRAELGERLRRAWEQYGQ